MAIGRINGPMLYNNLERLGVDLAIDGNLIYFDVTNRRVGISNSTPQYAFDSPGNVRTANLTITNNKITSNTGKIDLGTISNVTIAGGDVNYIIITDGYGNLTFSNINALAVNANLSGSSIYGNVGSADIAWKIYTQPSTTNTIYYPSFTNINSGNAEVWVDNQYTYNPATGILALPTITSHAANVTTGNILNLTVSQGFNSPNVHISGGYINNLANVSSDIAWITTLNTSSGNVSGPLYADSITTSNLVVTGTTTGTVETANVALFEHITNTLSASVFFPSFYDTDATGNAQIYVSTVLNYEPIVGNLTTNNFRANTNVTANVLVVDYVQPKHLDSVQFHGNTAIRLPTGNTSQRPPVPAIGYIRYNSELGKLEYHDGDEWIPVELNAPTIGSQTFYADGVSQSFPLDSPNETAQGLLVSINGTTQVPDVAYTVAANVITFAETLNSSDLIDIRFLSTGSDNGIVNASTPTFSANTTQVLDSFLPSQFRTVKYQVQAVDYGFTPNKVHVAEIMVFHDDNGASTQAYKTEYAVSYNEGSLGTFDVAYSTGMINLTFTPNYVPTSMIVRLSKTSIAT